MAVVTGTFAVAAAGTGAHSRRTTQSGVAVVVVGGLARIASGMPAVVVVTTHTVGGFGKRVASAGTASVAVAGTAQQVKRVAVGGVCAVAVTGAGAAGKRTAAAGVAAVAAVGTAQFAAKVRGTAAVTVTTTGRASKRATQSGTAPVAVAGTGRAARRAPTGGRSLVCLTPFGTALRRAPTGGRTLLTVTGRSFPVVPGPTVGTRISPPRAVPDGPVAGSRIVWSATLDGGTLLVETSIDGGVTWQPVVSGGPVPRLDPGDTRTARTVLVRTTQTRATSESPSPRLHRMEIQVAVDASRTETVPVGVFTLNDVEIGDSARGLTIELAGADLSRRVSRNRWDDTYIIEASTNFGTAIADLVRNRYPGAAFNFASTERTTPRLFFGEQSSNDPWQDAQDMALAIGYELFFDARGICTLRPEPDPDVDASVWTFDDLAHPTMVELRRRVTDENTYNKVIITGEGSGVDVPVRAVAIDDDPASATYYLGPYGTVTDRSTTPMVTSVEQAQDAANARLLRVKGATEAVDLTVVPMPALEPGDVVTVIRGRSKVQGRFLLDQLRVPLGADEAMRAVGRRQRQ